MNESIATLRREVEQLTEYAFQHHLISGYGDGEHPDQYQIVYQGKPRHFSLEHARNFLNVLIQGTSSPLAAVTTSETVLSDRYIQLNRGTKTRIRPIH